VTAINSPAAAMTYDSLTQDIKAYLERGNTSDETVLRQIPIIINNCERALADKMKIQGYRDVITSTMQQQVNVIDKPQGWRNTVSINIGTGVSNNSRVTLRVRSYAYLRIISPDDTSYGQPQWYSDYDFNHWIVAPTPDNSYPFEAIVYRLPDLLSSSNQQNYLTQFTPFLLLYECLTAMEPFLRNDTRMPLWMSKRDEQFANINTQEMQKVVDRAALRTGA
jgi:hypothetical protein